jgi:hypothetical protein
MPTSYTTSWDLTSEVVPVPCVANEDCLAEEVFLVMAVPRRRRPRTRSAGDVVPRVADHQ